MRKVTVPEGTSGDFTVRRFTIDDHASAMSAIRHRGRGIPVGEYTGLYRGRGLFDDVVMSDTPSEMEDHEVFVRHATGHILINGLGLGMVLQACLDKPEVTHVAVVEISEDVIKLVGPHYTQLYGARVDIIHANAFTYIPGGPYGAVWHDIWDNPHPSVLPEMTKLKRKYARRTEWQGCWAQELIKEGRI
jgi:spermidine synthase